MNTRDTITIGAPTFYVICLIGFSFGWGWALLVVGLCTIAVSLVALFFTTLGMSAELSLLAEDERRILGRDSNGR